MAGDGRRRKRLAEIRASIAVGYMVMDEQEAFWAMRDLLAEVERLRAREAALVAVAQAVAASDGHMARLWDGTPAGYMLLPEHEGIIEQARALLASVDSEQRSGGDGE